MTGTSCRNVQAAAASGRSKQKTTLKRSPGHLPGTPWGCGLSALAMAAMSSCCQQTSATPSIRESVAARSASWPFAKRRSTSIPSFAASGLIVSSGRRLLCRHGRSRFRPCLPGRMQRWPTASAIGAADRETGRRVRPRSLPSASRAASANSCRARQRHRPRRPRQVPACRRVV